jgi:hypothetical protein
MKFTYITRYNWTFNDAVPWGRSERSLRYIHVQVTPGPYLCSFSFSPLKIYGFNMPFDLFAATIADLPAVVSVFHAAFDEDPNFKWMCPDCDPAEIYSWNLENFRQTWNKPGRRLFKAVDMDKETG